MEREEHCQRRPQGGPPIDPGAGEDLDQHHHDAQGVLESEADPQGG